MATLRVIITNGFRESGIIPVGSDPAAEELAEGLRRMEIIIKTLIGNQLGDKLYDLSFGEQGLSNSYGKAEDMSDTVNSTFVPLNSRIVFNNEAPVTLYLHPRPQDGSRLAVVDSSGNFATNTVTLNGNGRRIETVASVLLDTASVQREWFYRADLGSWQRITTLTEVSESPFPQEFDDYLSLLLTLRLNPRYGAETRPELMEMLKTYEGQFRARYRQTTEVDPEYALQRIGHYNRFYKSGSTDYFNRGW